MGGLNDPSAWEQLTLFLVIVREKCDSACGGKALCSGRNNAKKKKSPLKQQKGIAYRALEALKVLAEMVLQLKGKPVKQKSARAEFC